MRMKDVCQKTGLTDRAVRLYIDSGLVKPKKEMSYTGRSAIYFDDADIETLNMVAILRKAGFSIADIKKMLEFPQEIPAVISTYRAVLEEEISTKQDVLKSLSSLSHSSFESCFTLAAAFRKSSPDFSILKEDIYMSFEDIKKMIRRRITSIFAFVALIISMVVFLTLGIKTVFTDVNIIPGGQYVTNYVLVIDGLNSVLTFVPALLAASAAGFMIPHLAGGRRRWLIISAVLCFFSAVAVFLLPNDVSSRMFFHEFLAYRYSFMHDIFYVTGEEMDVFISSLKFIPNIAAAILIIVELSQRRSFFE